MSNAPLMPKATAVWLIDNTSLTFEQIADFCKLHPLEVKGIADGDVAQGIKGMDPISAGQLTREELEKAVADPAYRMKLAESKTQIPVTKKRKGPRYTPLSRRQDRPDAIAWLLRNHPELSDGQIMKLVGTTKPTINAIRERTHWNSANIKPVDPVTLALCSQIDLDTEVRKAARRAQRQGKLVETAPEGQETLAPVQHEIAEPVGQEPAGEVEATAQTVFSDSPAVEAAEAPQEEDIDADSVFAKLKELKSEDGGEAS